MQHLTLEIQTESNLKYLKASKRSRYYAIAGSISSLIDSHNSLCDSAENQSAHNRVAISLAASLLERAVHDKTDYLNAFLDANWPKARKRVKNAAKPKKKARASKLKKAKRAGK